MKKYFSTILIIFLSLSLIACSNNLTTSSCSYKIETGEIITVELDSKYEQVADIPFQIKKDSQVIFIGNFLSKDWCLDYIKQSIENRVKIKDGNIGENSYYLFKDETLDEYEYLVFIHDSEIAVSLVSNGEMEELEECFYSMNVSQITN
mgnify:CR=1 FL=1|jgi:hypothetical protein